jgi:hypothetical protein
MTSEERDNERLDDQLLTLMQTLDPPSHRLAQLEDAVFARVKPSTPPRSLAAEWVELLRVRPLFTSGLALAGGAALLLLNPSTGLLAALLG